MCGITGFLNVNGGAACGEILRRMTDVIAHRGPDGDGHVIDESVALGHRRLSIIDLSAAASQPMTSADGRFVITYNGEIYNFKELRLELEATYPFATRSDTEVLLAAWATWGEACLLRLNGMFAFAIWDRREKELVLARDRFGVKPLYYGWRGGTFAFGSEVKAILRHPQFSARLDEEALVEYLTFQNFFGSRTLFAGVQLLPPATILRVRRGESAEVMNRYWDYNFEEDRSGASESEYAEELDRLFRRAVSRQLVSDVDVGCYLSGGIDSGSITAVAARQVPHMNTFTCGFDLSSASGLEMSFDEREKAEMMSYRARTEHYEMVLKAGDMERSMSKLVWHLEEPRVGQSYPNFYASKLASKFVKVVLSGAGGDELFGGYPWRYYRAVRNDSFDQYVDKYYGYWQRLLDHGNIKRVLRPIWPRVEHVRTRELFANVFETHASSLTRPEDYVNHSLYFEARTFLHGLLVVEDKLSMAHSLEARVPFLDNDLVDFAMRLPVRMKLGNLQEIVRLNENETGPKTDTYFERTHDGKRLLRQVMERYVPREVSERPKQGFSAPDASWFRGESIEFVRRTLGDRRARLYDVLDYEATQVLLSEHMNGSQNRRLLVWSLLYLETFMKTFIDGAR